MMNVNGKNYLNSHQKLLRKNFLSQVLQHNNSPLFSSNASAISVRTTDDTSLIAQLEIKICMHQGAYRGSHFIFYVEPLEDYPFRESNVEIWAAQPIWHPNIDVKSGRVSLNMKCKDLVAVVMAIQRILLDPAVEPVINVTASATLNKSRESFEEMVSRSLNGATVNDVSYPCMKNLYCPNCVVPQSYLLGATGQSESIFATKSSGRGFARRGYSGAGISGACIVSSASSAFNSVSNSSSSRSIDNLYCKKIAAQSSVATSNSLGNVDSSYVKNLSPHSSFTKFFDENCSVNKRTIIDRESPTHLSRNSLCTHEMPWFSNMNNSSYIENKESKFEEPYYGIENRKKVASISIDNLDSKYPAENRPPHATCGAQLGLNNSIHLGTENDGLDFNINSSCSMVIDQGIGSRNITVFAAKSANNINIEKSLNQYIRNDNHSNKKRFRDPKMYSAASVESDPSLTLLTMYNSNL